MHVLAVKNSSTLLVNDLSLLVVNTVILKKILSYGKVVTLDLLLCLLYEVGNSLMLYLLALILSMSETLALIDFTAAASLIRKVSSDHLPVTDRTLTLPDLPVVLNVHGADYRYVCSRVSLYR